MSRRLRFELERQQIRIGELQALLDKRDGVLKLQASKLKHNNAQYERLQQEADEYLDMLFDVIQTSSLHVDNLARLDAQSPSGTAGEDRDESMDTLRVALVQQDACKPGTGHVLERVTRATVQDLAQRVGSVLVAVLVHVKPCNRES